MTQPSYFLMPLPAPIWSTNADRNLNPYTRAERIKLWKTATRHHYQRIYGRSPQVPSVVSLFIPVKDRRKRDPHNFCGTVLKAVIDGLVQAGAWPDDTPEYVGHREPVFQHKGRLVIISWSPMPERKEHEGVDFGDSHLTTENQVRRRGTG